MFVETLEFAPYYAAASPASARAAVVRADRVEFFFPLPLGKDFGTRPPRAILSLREAGSMRYLPTADNPRRRAFFEGLGIDSRRVVATELHHTRRLKLVEAREMGIFPNGDGETDLGSLKGPELGDGGPDGAEGRDGFVFFPPRPASEALRGETEAGPLPVPTVTVADCMPIWLWDAVSGAVGLLHSGWKGTGILEHAIGAMVLVGKTSPDSLSVILGPSIGVCCYEVPESRAAYFETEFGSECVDRSGMRPRLDIRAANLSIARRLGVGALLSVDACTSCDPILGSYRREGPESFTRMVAVCIPP